MGLDRVKDLIDHGSGEWRGDLLELLFSPVECEAIRAIPIPRSAQADARCWDYTTDGKYTICTGYKLAVEDPIEEPGVDDQEEEAPQAPVACDWSALWKTQVPPKVRYFLWKVMHDILPTNVNLMKKLEDKISADCPYCGIAETQLHRFMECAWSRRIWRRSLWTDRYTHIEEETVQAWLNRVLTTADQETIGGICCLLWFLWVERNNQVFNGPKLEEEEIARKAEAMFREYKSEQEKLQVKREGLNRRRVQWEPPSVGVLKVNTDAGWFGNEGTSLAMVVRDWTGEFVFAAARRETENWSPPIAEGRAILFAMEQMNEREFGPYEIESDCLVIINRLEKQSEDLSELGTICQMIWNSDGMRDCRAWRHTNREGNTVAHKIAHYSMHAFDCNSWLGSPPSFVLNELYSDLSHLA
ncbi:unnamed protein product [Linum trigynum]